MISISDLRFRYPRDQFDLRISELRLAEGASAAVTGPSGSGKTTLLNLIAGILLPETGRVCVGETVVNQLSEAARREFRLRHIGQVFQDFQLIEYLNVRDNVLLPCRLNSSQPLSREIRDRASQLLDNVGLADRQSRPVTRLSQGERQRVAICRALLLNPVLLLADEPTGNLDPQTSQRILELLLTQSRIHNATLIVVTHDYSLLPCFDRVIPFEDFLSQETTSSLSQQPGAAR